MQLKEWRKKRKLSQFAMAKALEAFANQQSSGKPKKLGQTTLGHWERGTLPRRPWLVIISDFTKNQVTPADFAMTEKPMQTLGEAQ